jgi:hypothetical protein
VKNITPKREMSQSKPGGSKAWVCASARMKPPRDAFLFGAGPGSGDHRFRDGEPLPREKIDQIRDWILEGAPNN